MTDTVSKPLRTSLRRAPFRWLTIGWFFTNFGDSALYLVLAIWVKNLTGSDAAAATVFVCLGLPALIAPFAGQLADRVSRRKLLIATNFSIAVIVLALLFVKSAEDIWIIYAVTLAYGTAAYLTAAAQAGLLRDMLPDEELGAANGFFQTIDQGLRIVSPLIGTGLYVLLGGGAVAVFTAACFVAMGCVLFFVKVTESVAEARAEGVSYWSEVTEGARALFSEPTLRLLTIAVAISFGAAGLINVLAFPLIEQGLGQPPETLSVLVTIQGVGAVLGGITSAAVLRKIGERRLVGLGLWFMSLGLVMALASVLFTPSGSVLGFICMALALGTMGFGIPWVVVGIATYRMRVTPARLQGRTSAAMNVAFNVPSTIATIAGAALIAVVDYRILVVVCIVAIAAVAIVCRPFKRDAGELSTRSATRTIEDAAPR
ncbi:MFS transporter [Humidisolicoccus flavus]|uniref:MFS transporter n=1 Tax=Humidisolicoccus flavus TaxID=3111414 RepID=UPI0032476BDD